MITIAVIRETDLTNDPDEKRRALNGFMLLTFDGPALTEQYRGEKGDVRKQLAPS